MQACKNCYFARIIEENGNHVQCQRFPPQVHLIPQQDKFTGGAAMGIQAISPPVPVDHWCGEFRPVPASTMTQ